MCNNIYVCMGVCVLSVDNLPSPKPQNRPPSKCGYCWMLLVSLCPTCSLLSAFVSSTCVYCLLRKKGKSLSLKSPWTMAHHLGHVSVVQIWTAVENLKDNKCSITPYLVSVGLKEKELCQESSNRKESRKQVFIQYVQTLTYTNSYRECIVVL